MSNKPPFLHTYIVFIIKNIVNIKLLQFTKCNDEFLKKILSEALLLHKSKTFFSYDRYVKKYIEMIFKLRICHIKQIYIREHEFFMHVLCGWKKLVIIWWWIFVPNSWLFLNCHWPQSSWTRRGLSIWNN